MSAASLIITGEIFLVLLVIGGGVFYYLNSLNTQLVQNNESLKQKLKEEKKHLKALRERIQELTDKLSAQKEQLLTLAEKESQLSQLETQCSTLETELSDAQSSYSLLQSQLNDALNTIQEKESAEASKVADSGTKTDYEEMYYDLKNSIAYNMEGGGNYLDILKERLRDNGNIEESQNIEQLKERYNSISQVVGIVSDVEMFNQEEEPPDTLENIRFAEGAVDQANSLLKDIASRKNRDLEKGESEQDSVILLKAELGEVNLIKDKLETELEKSAAQLMAFVAKARLFQAQKDQIKMHKATEAQLHRNFVNLNAEYKLLARKHKTVDARNEVLNIQLKKMLEDDEAVSRIESMREDLEQKEQEIDRLSIEKEMLEQQYIMMSDDFSEEAESSDALERLRSEHELLEGQFMEVLNELKTEPE